MNMHYTLNLGQKDSVPFGISHLPVQAEDSSRRGFSSDVQNSLFLAEKMNTLADKYLSDDTVENLNFYLLLKAKTSSLTFILNEIFDVDSAMPENAYSVSHLDTFRLGIHTAERLSSTILDSVALLGNQYLTEEDSSNAIRDFSAMNNHIKSISKKKAFSFSAS